LDCGFWIAELLNRFAQSVLTMVQEYKVQRLKVKGLGFKVEGILSNFKFWKDGATRLHQLFNCQYSIFIWLWVSGFSDHRFAIMHSHWGETEDPRPRKTWAIKSTIDQKARLFFLKPET
jgi:hypothetical protein